MKCPKCKRKGIESSMKSDTTRNVYVCISCGFVIFWVSQQEKVKREK
jgi:predicted RNA-binding Zn-ribbon protein involved in translation (DUF1610 family)